nr:Gfo/Idh/MocA family oxidoreductase [Planococcus glaciei]
MISIGIIGAGIVGERIIKQIQQEGRVQIKGVYDEQQERLQFLHDIYGVPICESFESILHSNIDWLYIGTPPASHAEIAKRAAGAGIHVLSEKPLAHNAEDGKEMVEAAKRTGSERRCIFRSCTSRLYTIWSSAYGAAISEKWCALSCRLFFPDWPRAWQQNPWIASRSQGGFVREVFPHYLQLFNRVFGELTILSHHITYPEQAELCETGIVAHGVTAGNIPFFDHRA